MLSNDIEVLYLLISSKMICYHYSWVWQEETD